MPLVHRLLVTLRTLMEDEPQPPKNRRRRPNNGGRSNRNRQTTALVLTFRDLFRSGGLNIILDEMDANRRPSPRNSRSSLCVSNRASSCTEAVLCVPNQPTSDSRIVLSDQIAPAMTSPRPYLQEETVPLLCMDLVPSPLPVYPSGLFSGLALVRRKKPENLPLPLNPEDENKTVETLKKVLKWSPRKQNSATFAVSVPVEEKHTALAVVENAVNRVKEEELMRKKKRRRFLWLKLC